MLFILGYCEKRVFADPHPGVQPPSICYRYVDDIFAVFESTSACKVFLAYLNSLHPSPEFTLEMERSGVLPFLDVLVEKSADAYKTTVYRKSTFTGQYTRSDSYSSSLYKIGLIGILVNRARKICSTDKLHAEIETIKMILLDKGYPEQI